MEGRLSKLFAVFIISAIVLSATSVLSFEGFTYDVLEFYDVHISFTESPPKTSMKFYVPVTQGMFERNSTGVSVYSKTKITEEFTIQYSYVLKVEHSRRESYSYVASGAHPSRRLSLLLNESGASLESVLYAYDTGEVLKYVKVEVVPSKSLYERIREEPVTYLVRAVFYGSGYEGLSVDVVKENITSILEPELALVIPYYSAHPELAGAMYANRTVGEVDVEFRDGRFYAAFKVIDENRVLPVIVYRKVSLDEVCKPTLGLEYDCQMSYEEDAVQMVSYSTLKRMIDGTYGVWRKAVRQPNAEDKDVWREKVEPVEREMWGYLSLALYIHHSPLYPQDPLLWLAITDAVLVKLADVEVLMNFTLDRPSLGRGLNLSSVSDYWTLKKLVANVTRVPVEVVLNFKHIVDLWSVVNWSAMIVMSAMYGFRLHNVSEFRNYFIQRIRAPRMYATLPSADLLLYPDLLYSSATTMPFQLNESVIACKRVLHGGVVWGEDSCVIYTDLQYAGEVIYLALHPEIVELLDTPTMPMPTTAITTPSPASTAGVHTATTRPYTTTTTTAPEELGKPPTSDVLMPALLALIAILAAVGCFWDVVKLKYSE